MELRRGSQPQHRRGCGVHPAGVHRRHAGSRRPGARAIQGGTHDPPARWRGDAGVSAPTARLVHREKRMSGVDTGDTTVALDPENPWLGLFSYSEETRAYFHGRDEEAAELARRVQRKLLTV